MARMFRSPVGRGARSATAISAVGMTAWWSVTWALSTTWAAFTRRVSPSMQGSTLATAWHSAGRPPAISSVRYRLSVRGLVASRFS